MLGQIIAYIECCSFTSSLVHLCNTSCHMALNALNASKYKTLDMLSNMSLFTSGQLPALPKIKGKYIVCLSLPNLKNHRCLVCQWQIHQSRCVYHYNTPSVTTIITGDAWLRFAIAVLLYTHPGSRSLIEPVMHSGAVSGPLHL